MSLCQIMQGNLKRFVLSSVLLVVGLLIMCSVPYAQEQPACVKPPSGMISWWSFDQTTGTIAQDRIGNYPGSYTNGPLPAEGEVHGSLRFNGTNYIAVQDSDVWAFGDSDFTIEFWVNFDTPGGGSYGHPSHIFIGNDEGPGWRNKWFFALGGGTLEFHYNSPSIGDQFLRFEPFAPNLNQWYHLAVVKQGSLYSAFVNGTPAGSVLNTIPIPNPNAPLTIGEAEELGFMNGRLDELSIYNRALSQAEIRGIYDAGSAGKCLSLSIRPDKGGDTGPVSVHINGKGFAQGATVKLVKTGEADIAGDLVKVGEDNTTLETTFDLTGKARGLWDVVVTNPDGKEFILTGGFTIEEGRSAQVWVDIVGLPVIVPGRAQSFQIFYGNRGNVDAIGVPLWVAGIPSNGTLKLGFDVLPPLPIGDEPVDYSMIPTSFDIDGELIFPLLIPVIPAGYTGALQFSIKIPNFQNIRLRAWTNPSWFGSPSSQYLMNSNPSCLKLGLQSEQSLIDTSKCLFAILKQVLIDASGDVPLTCMESFLLNLSKDLYSFNTGQPVNLPWTILQMTLDCGTKSACLMCKLRLTQACVVCVGGSIFKYGKDLVDAYKTGEDCANAALAASDAMKDVFSIGSMDPNDKVGSEGAGDQKYLSGEEPLRYSIFFENLETATAPAQEVVITDQLDTANMDLTTLSLAPIAFGNNIVTPPQGLSAFNTDVDLRPDKNVIVRIAANLNPNTGVLTWRLTSIDPATGQLPEDPRVGFLSPDVNPPEGDGSVLFTIMPKQGLGTGTEIRNQASIVFDVNPPIVTPQWLNTLDSSKPSSHILPLATTQYSTDFLVEWTGLDEGAGIQKYDIYVSDSSGRYELWTSTSETSATFHGELEHQYSFYSRAKDRVGNIEDTPAIPDITTTVKVPDHKTICSTLGKYRWFDIDTFTFNGVKGERIKVTLEPDSTKRFRQGKVTLIVKKDRSNISMKTRIIPMYINIYLPITTTYDIIVQQGMYPHFRNGFDGDYCITLESSGDAWKTLQPTTDIE